MALPRIRFTRADYDRLPEDMRVELIDGELLKMAPPTVRHQWLAMRVVDALRPVVGEGRVFIGPVGFAVDETHVLVPDVVALVEAPPVDAADISTALLVVEVLSPSTAARDRMVKTGLYLGAGVREVWLVDPRAETIELRTVDGERGFRKAEVAESAAVPGFRLEPGQLFQLQG